MHEIALCRSIVDRIAAQARTERFSRVRRVRIALGALSSAEPAAVEFGFGALSRGTVAEGARLEIERVPGAARCRTCGTAFAVEQILDPCPVCAGHDLEVTGGDEMRLREIEVI